jgi:hypothetical protein
MKASSQPKALTMRKRTKHRKQTAINEIPRKTVVMIKIDSERPSRGNILTAQILNLWSIIHACILCAALSPTPGCPKIKRIKE